MPTKAPDEKLKHRSERDSATKQVQMSRAGLLVVGMLIGVVVALFYGHLCLRSQPYRLGDYVRRSGGFEHEIKYFWYRFGQHRRSIVRQYGSRTTRSNDMDVLNEIVKARRTETPAPETLVVHIRLGDVIDNHARSVDDFVSGDYTIGEKENSMGGWAVYLAPYSCSYRLKCSTPSWTS